MCQSVGVHLLIALRYFSNRHHPSIFFFFFHFQWQTFMAACWGVLSESYRRTGFGSVSKDFQLNVSQFGGISGAYLWLSVATCCCVWRCVTALEYILVRWESVCVNVCQVSTPPHISAHLTPGTSGKQESVLQNAARWGTQAEVQLRGTWAASATEPCSWMHVCRSRSASVIHVSCWVFCGSDLSLIWCCTLTNMGSKGRG